MRLLLLALLVLCCCALSPSAGAVSAPAAPAPPPDFTCTLSADPSGASLALPPTTVWTTPAATAARAQIAGDLALLCHGAVPATASWAAGFQAASLTVLPASLDDPDRSRAPYALGVRDAQAQALAHGLGAGLPPATAGAVRGAGNRTWFVGAQDGLLALGSPTAVAAGIAPVPAAGTPGAHARLALGPALQLARALEEVGISYNLDPLLPGWRSQAPVVEATIAPGAQSWIGTTRLTAAALPVHVPDAAIARLSVEREVRLVVGINPRVLTQLLANALSVSEQRSLEERLGMSLDRAAMCFSGDIAASIDAHALLPRGAIVLGLRPGGGAQLFARQLASAVHGQELAPPEHGVIAWTLATAIGPCQLSLNDRILVLANDPELARSLLDGTAPPAPVPPGTVAFLAADLPALASQWLPVAWPLLAQAHLDLAPDPLAEIARELPLAVSFLLQTRGSDVHLADLLAQPPPVLAVPQGDHVVQWTMPPSLQTALAQVLAGAPPATLDSLFGCYSDPRIRPVAITTVVVRLADGLHLLGSGRHPLAEQPIGAALRQRLATLSLALGSDPDHLALLTPPPVPRLSTRWLPDPGALTASLAPYRLEVRAVAGGLEASEFGEPLGAAAVMASGAYLTLVQMPRMLAYQQGYSGQPRPAPPATPGPPVVEF